MIKNSLITLTVLSLFVNSARCQNITGIWEGIMGDEYLKLNIVQNGNQLCGYTFDFVLKDKKSYCKTYFTGNFDPALQVWTIVGRSFIVNSGDHVLMTLKFWHPPRSSRNELRGMEATGNSFFNFLDIETGNNFWLKKTAASPSEVPGFESVCFVHVPDKAIKSKPSEIVSKRKVNVQKKQPVASDDTVAINKFTRQQTETALLKVKEKEGEKYYNKEAIDKINSRKNIFFSTLVVHEPEVEIKLYDNGIVDNDTVSIYYNQQLLRSKQRLTETPITIKLKIDPNQTNNELILYAENLGGIPPNTALIVVTAGKKRYELHASANMKENAVLIFKYEP